MGAKVAKEPNKCSWLFANDECVKVFVCSTGNHFKFRLKGTSDKNDVLDYFHTRKKLMSFLA